jgi:hypothetical protein
MGLARTAAPADGSYGRTGGAPRASDRRGGRGGRDRRPDPLGTGNRDRPADLPIVVELVDTEEKIAGILPVFDEMVGDGMMTLETVHIVTYRAAPKTD